MGSLTEKRDLILEHEERFAASLAVRVLLAPKMNIWMILIPLILVYHMVQHRRVVDGRKGFVRHYLQVRRRALDESLRAVEKGAKPRVEKMIEEFNLDAAQRGPLQEFCGLIAGHYMDLLRSDGEDMASFVRAAYRKRTHYLLFLNRLKDAEKSINEAFKPYVADPKGVDEVLRAMESASQELRRAHAASVFP